MSQGDKNGKYGREPVRRRKGDVCVLMLMAATPKDKGDGVEVRSFVYEETGVECNKVEGRDAYGCRRGSGRKRNCNLQMCNANC